jgi:RNA polymerase sigma-70 factor, ECF subfamily
MDPGSDNEATPTAPVARVQVPLAMTRSGVLTSDAYEQDAPAVYGLLVRVLRDREAAADLLSETFIRLLNEERAGRWPDRPRAWLFRVASNLATSRGRRLQVAQRVERVLEIRERDRNADAPEGEVLRREQRHDLDRALAALAPEARAALLLAAQGFDGAAIASMLGRSQAGTRTMMCRARMRLRELLREEVR